MRSFFKNYGFAVFIIVALLHILAIWFHNDELRTYTKPLLIPLLAMIVYGHGNSSRAQTVFISALLFSFLGDVLLMCEHIHELNFIFGLLTFLTAHILYIIFFGGIKSESPSILKLKPWIILLVFLYGLLLLLVLWPYLGPLKIPVTVYAVVLCSMLICAIAVFKKVNRSAANYFLLGALLFVASDSILAINKFYLPFQFASLLIMLTYCAAQYFLTKGFIKYQD